VKEPDLPERSIELTTEHDLPVGSKINLVDHDTRADRGRYVVVSNERLTGKADGLYLLKMVLDVEST
jgi:hypothetical protein